jgi:hypothetical protein
MSEPEKFIDDIRSSPQFIEAAANDPVWHEHANAIENGVQRIYELGADDPVWLERFDEIQMLFAREGLTLRERLLRFAEMAKPWHSEFLRRRGH